MLCKRPALLLALISILTINQSALPFAAAQAVPKMAPRNGRLPSPFPLPIVMSEQKGPVEPSHSGALIPGNLLNKDVRYEARSHKRSPNAAPLFLPAYEVYGNYLGGLRSIAVADVNGDGKPDFIYANNGFYCVNGVLLGNGDGTFQAPTCYDAGDSTVYNVSVADMNGDGKLDLVVAMPCDNDNGCATGEIGVLLGNGDGTFQPILSNTVGIPGAGLGTLAVGDVNGDGKLDVVAFCGSSGTMLVLLGNGDGTLQTPQNYNPPYGDPPGGSTQNMAGGGLDSTILADVNGDGYPDIVMLSFCVANNDCSSGLVGFLLGNGDGTFQSSSSSSPLLENTFRTNAYLSNGMTVADVNGDGILDVAVASSGTSGSDGVVSVLLGLGGGLYPNAIFSPAVNYDSGGLGGVSIAVGDVNGDGKVDLVALSSSCTNCSDSSTVAVFLGNGDGTFQPPQKNTSGTFSGGPMLLADVNGDGILDVVANANQDFVLLGTLGKTIPTATTVSSSLNPSSAGQTVTFTASITPRGPSSPTGTVTFKDGSTVLGSAPVSSGMASLSTNALAAGIHSITASYNGDASYTGSASAPLMQVVNVAPTTTQLTSSMNPSVSGKPVAFTATVSPQSGGGKPTGKVQFLNGTTVLATVMLTSGTAKYATTKLAPGSNSVTAVYGGSPSYNGSTSTPLIQVVLAATTTTLTSSPNPSAFGEAVVFRATVGSSIGAPPDGESVTFKQGATVLGTGTLSGGIATFSTSTLGLGVKGITAVYGGDSNFAASTSTVFRQTVSKASSTTTLVSSLNPSTFGQPVTFTATVTPQFSGTPTGTVTFTDGTTILKTVPLSGGTAQLTTSKLASGMHGVTATYNGSVSFSTSSGSLTQTVN